MRHSYIGVTGVTTPKEAEETLLGFPPRISRKLMIGVLVSRESMRGEPVGSRWEKQFPPMEGIDKLFLDDPKLLNLFHYSNRQPQASSMLADMLKLHDIGGPNLHGTQLNIPWPQINQLDDYRRAVGYDSRIVLQIGKESMVQAGHSFDRAVEMLSHYIGLIDDILFDMSGGTGHAIYATHALEFLRLVSDQRWDLGFSVAGGLGPNSTHLVTGVHNEFTHLSIDAQHNLRDEEDNLHQGFVNKYLFRASQMLK
jgi:hypothetical protein